MRYLLAALLAAVGLAAAQEVTPQRGVSFNATGLLPSHTHESASQGGSALRFVSFIRVGSSALGPVIQSTQTHTNLGNSSYTGANGFDNRYATVVGGISNSAKGEKSFIGGGGDNETVSPTGLGEGDLATISGGAGNRAGYGATVGGGGNSYGLVGNRALGDWSTIPGGLKNLASGAYSFAAGRQSSATAAGAWAISDSQAADFVNAVVNSFAARFAGGFSFMGGNFGVGDATPTQKLDVSGTIGINDVQALAITAGNFVLGNPAGGGTQNVWISANGDYRLKVQGDGGVHVPGGITASSVTSLGNFQIPNNLIYGALNTVGSLVTLGNVDLGNYAHFGKDGLNGVHVAQDSSLITGAGGTNPTSTTQFEARARGTNTEYVVVISSQNGSVLMSVDKKGNMEFAGTDPTISAGCGTSPSVTGTNNAMTIVVGTGGTATSCTVTFANSGWTNIPKCVSNHQGAILVTRAVPTATTVVIDAATPFTASGKIDVLCKGDL